MLAHVAADFAFQPDALIIAKRKVWGIAIHVGIFAAAMTVTLRDYLESRTVVIAVCSLVLFHFGVDLAKSHLQKKIGRESLWLFTGDQMLHIASLLVVSHILRFRVIDYMPAYGPLALAIVAVWGGPVIFEIVKAEVTGSYLKPNVILGQKRGYLSLMEGGVLFTIGLQFGWFIFGLLILVPRIVGWFKGREIGIAPYCWGFAFVLGLIARFILLQR
jgi:hypothetical protein